MAPAVSQGPFFERALKDYYRILSIPENAKEADIKLAYRRLAKRYHPDMNAGDQAAEERFKEILEAYNTLSDAELKRAYDTRRLRNDTFSNYTAFYTEPKKEKKDPRRKEYSEEDLGRARAFHKQRITAQMERRKKLLVGMIITFVLYLCASGGFEYYIQQNRKKESEELAKRLTFQSKPEIPEVKTRIENMDSPYDPLFGEGLFVNGSPDYLVIYNPNSDALICAVEHAPPHRTIRNEFVYANNGFAMRELPAGSYDIKIYRGSNWNMEKRIPGGRKLGGFMKDEEFFRATAGPFHLQKTDSKHPDAHVCDTLMLDPDVLKMEEISPKEFFNAGDK